MIYDFIYRLPVLGECKNSPGWYRLGWRLIRGGTYDFRISNDWSMWRCKFIGIRAYSCGWRNGWGRSSNGLSIELGLMFFTFFFWIRWNIAVMGKGPQDGSEKRPLDLSKLQKKEK